MSAEGRASVSMLIKSGKLIYQSQPTYFTFDVPTGKPPTPGRLTATTGGVNVDLTKLSSPGMCRIMNYDATNYVTFGKWDGTTFHPLQEVLPGETYIFRLSRTILSGSEFLRVVANTASCEVTVEAFERE